MMNTWHEPVYLEIYFTTDDANGEEETFTINNQPCVVYLTPMHPGVHSSTIRGLVASLMDGLGHRELVVANLDVIRLIVKHLYKPDTSVINVLTRWHCEVGYSYIPGEPDEYDSGCHLDGWYDLENLQVHSIDSLEETTWNLPILNQATRCI